jgi:hypothetical protein
MVLKLTIEPIPQCNWGISLAHVLPSEVWNTFRREVYKKSNYSCEICGCINRRLHCHEEWIYDERKKIQKLKDVHCICEYCHDIKHWGKSVVEVHNGKKPKDYLDTLEKHFCEVNKCSQDSSLRYRVKQGDLAQYRSKRKYTVDFDRFEPGKLIKMWSKSKR